MRITYIHQYFKTPAEAGGTRSYEFATRLARDGHEVTLICGGATAKRYEVNGFTVIQLAVKYANGMSPHRRMLAMGLFMTRAVSVSIRRPADIVFASSTPLSVAIPGILASWRNRSRFVFEVRDLWPSVPHELGILGDGPLYRAACLLERTTYRLAHHTIALSPGMADGIRRVDPKVPITIVPNASDHEVFYKPQSEVARIRVQLGWSDHDRVAVYAGSFGPTYDILRWLYIASQSRSWRFIIIGEGAQTDQARTLARDLGLDVDSILPGSMPKDEVARRLAACDVCLSSLDHHPALAVNSLNKVFDALAAGRPVAFSHDGWLPGMLIDTGAGWRLSDDPAAAARQLDLLTPEQVDRAAESARLLGLSFSRNAMYERFSDAILGSSRQIDGNKTETPPGRSPSPGSY